LVSGPGDAVIYHELMHSWYQGMLGTNESLYHWMDEGFATFAENRVMQFMNGEQNLQAAEYEAYFNIVRSGKEEPMITHADHFNTNYAYGIASYRKGAIFLEQLGYVVGAPVRDRILLEYYRQWKFKHPNPNDLLRIAEKESGIILDWYIQYWVNTTHTIDYSIDSLWEASGATNIRLRRIAPMPMPIDVKLTFKDGSSEWHYVPMYLMFGAKAPEEGQTPRKIYDAWKWTHATYQISTTHRLTDIVSVEIDPSQRMADIDRKNNRLELKW
jgi:aminopeptidase N